MVASGLLCLFVCHFFIMSLMCLDRFWFILYFIFRMVLDEEI